jgi:pachytene checkpoint protein 2
MIKLSYNYQAQGMSGRSLRRLPVLAHARYIGTSIAMQRRNADSGVTDVSIWLEAMEKVVDAQGIERGRLQDIA